jgi:hypothetical protein
MKYIHTFWSKPLYKNKFNKFNACLDAILSDYAYSANCIHKLNRKIVLFTDSVGAELLSFIDYDDVVKVRGMDIVFVTTAKTNEESFDLLNELGIPFKK